MIDERTKNVRKVAKLLAVDDGDVLQLLDDGRLAGVLEHKLKGVSGRQMLYEVNWRGE